MEEPARPQHLDALARANAVRLGAAELKRDIQAGRLTMAAALRDPRAESLRLRAFLQIRRRSGPLQAEDICRRLPVQRDIQMRDLMERHRCLLEELMVALDEGGRTPREIVRRVLGDVKLRWG